MHCQLTVTRLETDRAILVNQQGQEFNWPADQLPVGSQVGTIFNCALVNPNNLDDSDQAMAKAMLNELLKMS